MPIHNPMCPAQLHDRLTPHHQCTATHPTNTNRVNLALGRWVLGKLGQLVGPDGNVAMSPLFMSEGAYPYCYPGQGSQVSFIAASYSLDSLVPETLYRWDMHIVGEGSVAVDPIGMDPRPDHRNFYFPHCSDGVTGVQRFGRVIYEGVFPGIDLHLYAVLGGQQMAFVCQPGSDPTAVRLSLDGAVPELTEQGLLFHVLDQEIRFPQPFAYQFNEEGIVSVYQAGFNFALFDEHAAFTLGVHDPSLPLVLVIGENRMEQMGGGPDLEGLCWSTYFGGEKSDWIHASTKDRNDSYFVVGETRSSFPLFPSTGIVAISPSTGSNAFAAKFNAQDHLAWTTIVGAAGNTYTSASTVAVASSPTNDQVYVGGYTNSPNLPVQSFGSAYFDGAGSTGYQGFLMRFRNSDGLKTWTTYFGANGSQVYDIDFLGVNQLIVTGEALSTLPIPQVAAPPGATTYPHGGGQDAFVALFNANDQLRWITHYGGSGTESGRGIVSFGKSFYVLGTTQNGAIPIVNKFGAYNDPNANGLRDQFILLFNANAVNQWATYFGGDSWDDVFFSQNMAVHPSYGDLYIVGSTSSTAGSLPLLDPGAGSYYSAGSGPGTYGFIARFNGSTQALKWCTLFGGGGGGRMAVTVNTAGDVFTCGRLQGSLMPITPPQPYTYDQPLINWNSTSTGPIEQDCYVARFRSNNALDWCTYFGGNAGQGHEEMNTLLYKGYWLYAAGLTTKYQDPNSYFPLWQQPDPLAFFDPIWNQQPTALGSDAYIVKFCPAPLPIAGPGQKSVLGTSAGGLHLVALGGSQYRYVGTGKPGLLHVHNTMGQVVRSFHLSWAGDASENFRLDELAPGVYMVGLHGGSRTKLYVQP
ncbi:MAG: hypothetical protein IT230_10745 [Flavobacteriales bacterium]|nr:hypothetical protein [Flavobacteriales bacterium]